MGHIHWKTVRGEIVVASTKDEVSDAALELLMAKVAKVGKGKYVFADAGQDYPSALTARQRTAWSKFAAAKNIKTVALTDRSMIRHVATAMAWLTGDTLTAVFSAHDCERACAFLGVPPAWSADLRAAVDAVRAIPPGSEPVQD